MVPETHEIEFPSSTELREFLVSIEFHRDTAQKLKDQYVVEVSVSAPKKEKAGDNEILVERLVLNYTRNNAGGLKDAIDFLLLPLIGRGLDQNAVKGAIPRPKSDSFEDNMAYFESKLLQRAEPPNQDSPTRSTFGEEGATRSIFDKLRKPSSMASFTSFMDRRRKTGSNSPASIFLQGSGNASKASLVSMESRDSGYRQFWNDSGIDLDHDQQNGHHAHANSWGSIGGSSRPNTSSNSLSGAFETKFPFGVNGNASTSSLNTPMIPGLGMVTSTHAVGASEIRSASNGDVTPKYDAQADRSALGSGKGPSSSTDAQQPPISRPASSAMANTTTTKNASASTKSSGYTRPQSGLRE